MKKPAYKADEDGLGHLTDEEKQAYQVAYENSLQGAMDKLSEAAKTFVASFKEEYRDRILKTPIVRIKWKK